jgi:pimeloyl-ACP methyl ester carboxylesterase
MIKRVFQPAAVPERFHRLFPKELMLRPLQLRAAAEDAALMIPTTMELEPHYREIRTPVTIITGADDKISDVGRRSERLHQELAGSEFIALPGLGHMIHHLAPDALASAIIRASHGGGRETLHPRFRAKRDAGVPATTPRSAPAPA